MSDSRIRITVDGRDPDVLKTSEDGSSQIVSYEIGGAGGVEAMSLLRIKGPDGDNDCFALIENEHVCEVFLTGKDLDGNPISETIKVRPGETVTSELAYSELGYYPAAESDQDERKMGAKKMSSDEKKEQMWIRGNRAAWRRTLGYCLRELWGLGEKLKAERMLAEREDTIVQLRMICDEHGDNDWDEKLHLADVVDKHLGRYLAEEKEAHLKAERFCLKLADVIDSEPGAPLEPVDKLYLAELREKLG